MKFKLLFTGALLAISSAVFAMSEKPNSCPSVASIRTSGIEKNLHNTENHGWSVNARGKFNTDSNWWVGIGEMQALSYEDALWKVKVYLNQIAILRDGPLHITAKDYDGWICEYEAYNKHMMMAISPEYPAQSISFSKKNIKDVL